MASGSGTGCCARKVTCIRVAIAVLNGVAAVLVLLTANLPYVAELKVTVGNTAGAGVSVGFLLLENGSTFSVNLGRCSAGASDCTELDVLVILFYVLLVLGGLAYIANAVFCFVKQGAVFVASPVGFTLTAVSCFGYFVRVLPLIRNRLQSASAAVIADWSPDWVAYLTIAAVGMALIASLVTSLLYPKLARDAPVAVK